MTTPGTSRRTLTEILSEGRTLPHGYDTWGWKIVRPDLRTRDGFRWPWPGQSVTCPDPAPPEDGLCVAGLHIALTPAAMRDVRYGCSTVLLLAYRQADVIAAAGSKCRVSHAHVADVIDLQAVLRTKAASANLASANLAGADLARADLAGANLARANLARADLAGANLAGADLAGANLTGADLTRADLAGAYLAGADLTAANLTDADLRRSQLTDTQAAQITGTPAWITS